MVRLQKVIAQAGITSRRKAEKLILAGKVKVNGKTITKLGTKVNSNDRVEVNGVLIENESPVYFLLYKPRGVISSVTDDRNRKVVTDLIPTHKRIFPVGRLDFDTSGVLLLTNDGQFSNQLVHPKYAIEKTYVAKVRGIVSKESMTKLRKGILLEGGMTSPAKARVISVDRTRNTSIVELIITEGRNRQVRRMFEAISHPVIKLKRERFAFLDCKSMRPGEYRPLTSKEVKQLLALAKSNHP